jgi:hypothetical protein
LSGMKPSARLSLINSQHNCASCRCKRHSSESINQSELLTLLARRLLHYNAIKNRPLNLNISAIARLPRHFCYGQRERENATEPRGRS